MEGNTENMQEKEPGQLFTKEKFVTVKKQWRKTESIFIIFLCLLCVHMFKWKGWEKLRKGRREKRKKKEKHLANQVSDWQSKKSRDGQIGSW